MSPGLLTPRDRAQRKQRRSKQWFTASSLVVALPIFEFIGRHDSFRDLTTPSAIAHLATLAVGGWGMYSASRLRAEGAHEEAELTDEG
jgi:hypothetical protein